VVRGTIYWISCRVSMTWDMANEGFRWFLNEDDIHVIFVVF